MNEICVCAEPLVERGLYPCGHALCLSCTLKKRVLMKDMHCPYCRSNAAKVAVLNAPSSKYEDAQTEFRRGHLLIENDLVKAKLRHILQYPCPECDADQMDLKKLKKHLLDEHKKTVCDVCVKNEFNFSDEFVTYNPSKLKEHLKKRHIFCRYCLIYLYGTADFAAHCKKEHVSCDICERRDPEHPQYFEHYTQLRNHYQDHHYRCMERECLADMHIVFGTAVELQKHMVEAHHMSPQAVKVDVNHGKPPAVTESRKNSADDEEKSEKEDLVARYDARLKIVAEHDENKISKILGANTTYLNQKVPVEIYIATLESVLKSKSANSQITALLTTFARAYGPQMSPANLRSLNFQLYLRDLADQEQATAEKKQRIMATGSYAQQSGSEDLNISQRRGPAPTPIQPVNWGLNLPRTSGVSSLQNLPKLGSSRSTPSSHSASSASFNRAKPSKASGALLADKSYADPNKPALSLQDLPKLERKPKAPAPSLGRPNRSSPAVSLAQTHLQSSNLHTNLGNLSLGSNAVNNSRGVQLTSLPSLPKTKKEEKKRQHNVLRLK